MKTLPAFDFSSLPEYPRVPLGFARSAMFGVARHDRSQQVHNYPIATNDPRGIGFLYSGPKLSQYHSLLWQAIIQAAQFAKVVDDCAFVVSADTLLRAMGGKGNDSKQRERLWGWIKDLTAARVELFTRSQGYVGPLVFEVARDDLTRQVSIRLNAKLIRLLGHEVLRNDLARKAALGRNMLALWLHDYFATHQLPPPQGVAMLRDVCGSPLALPQFRQRLRAAMDLLKKGRDPLVVTWSIDRRDRLIVEKKVTRVTLLPPKSAEAQQRGIRHQDRKVDAIQKAREQRSRVAL